MHQQEEKKEEVAKDERREIMYPDEDMTWTATCVVIALIALVIAVVMYILTGK